VQEKTIFICCPVAVITMQLNILETNIPGNFYAIKFISIESNLIYIVVQSDTCVHSSHDCNWTTAAASR